MLYNRPQQIVVRQTLRRNATPPERILWQRLRRRQCCGLKFRRQYGIGRYVLDFYSPAIRLGIEIDGAHHDGEVAIHADSIRQRNIEAHDIKIIRYRATDVLRQLDIVWQSIVYECTRYNHPG